MEISSDPYEQKLYHMFKSHDTDANGSLDIIALSKLCKSLELNDKDNILIGSLLTSNDSRVTFKAFKEALLSFLGSQMDGGIENEKALRITDDELLNGTPNSPGREVSPKLVMGSKKYGRRSRPQSLVIDSSQSESENEANAVIPTVQRSSSQSEIHGPRRRRPNSGSKLKRCASLPAQKNLKVKEPQVFKSQQQQQQQHNQLASSVESLGNLDFENLSNTLYNVWTQYGNELGTHFLNRHQLKYVCERVGLRKIAGKVAEEVFDKLELNPNNRISFNDFFGLIQNDSDCVTIPHGRCTLNGKMDHDNDDEDDDDDATATIVPDSSLSDFKNSITKNDMHAERGLTPQLDKITSSDVVEMWESAGICNARELLQNLAFDDRDIQIPQLILALEDELKSNHGESQTKALLQASLTLRRAEVSGLQQAYRQLASENKTLQASNRDSNQRVAMLAQEIDERHMTLEERAKTEIRALEQRHAEVIRDLTSQLANDREHWANLNARLEARIQSLEQEEGRYKVEIQSLKDENSALETEQISLQKQVTELLETNIKLNNEIVDLEDKQRTEDGTGSAKDTEEVLELIDKITTLQVENTNLRDKNDELVAELEGMSMELSRCKNKKLSSSRTNLDLSGDNLSDDPEHSMLGVKRRGDSPSKTRIPDESPRTGKLRKCNNDNSESEASGDWVALNSELGTVGSTSTPAGTTSGFSQDFSSISDSKEEEMKVLKEKIAKLEKELKEYKKSESLIKDKDGQKIDDVSNSDTDLKAERDKFQSRCADLESSLEQMRKAYEDCEDYWQSKLNEERRLFEKERQIYDEEQKESDKKFTELMEKVREYDEQYSKEGRLSPIEERDTLEQQYTELEAEIEEIREAAKKMLEEKSNEVTLLQSQIEELHKKVHAGVNTRDPTDMGSPASSPINYLMSQSTIQAPARDYQNPNWSFNQKGDERLENLSTSETTIFSTTHGLEDGEIMNDKRDINPIQKPKPTVGKNKSDGENARDNEDTRSTSSEKSFDDARSGRSSSNSTHKSSLVESSRQASPNHMKEELKRLKLFEGQMKEHIKDLTHKRDSLIMELQQLQEVKPVLEKAYARAAHPTLLQRVNHLEQKNRHLQTILKQQQHYTETIMHQTWQQQRSEISDLRNSLETQRIVITEQAQRLTNADILVKDLYVENAHLTATIQRLEQQRSRANLLHQHQGLSGVPGLP